MRIFNRSESPNGSPDEDVRRAFEVLHKSNIFSARAGGTLGDRPVVLVAPIEVAAALRALEFAGLQATVDGHLNEKTKTAYLQGLAF
jgi:hypothetical protein